jgi:hypothetical protein
VCYHVFAHGLELEFTGEWLETTPTGRLVARYIGELVERKAFSHVTRQTMNGCLWLSGFHGNERLAMVHHYPC